MIQTDGHLTPFSSEKVHYTKQHFLHIVMTINYQFLHT